MEIYLVGGAIRDQLLGLSVTEKDWVVIGTTPEEMIKRGYKPVGQDFPVFLHPETGEEYALARTERKSGHGYQGFVFQTDSSVTLEEDLKRRDLTINAIAQTPSGDLIDPYHGQQDLQNKLLRHVSPAFAEDPLRILRIARFQAKLPDFSIADDTLVLMKHMVETGEADYLVAERVWAETRKALHFPHAARYLTTLHACGALAILFPAFEQWMPLCEILDNQPATINSVDRFALLCHNLSSETLKTLIKRYRIPKQYAEMAQLLQRHHTAYAEMPCDCADAILSLLQKTDATRRPERFEKFLSICALLYPDAPQQQRLQAAQAVIDQLSTKGLQEKNLAPNEFAEQWQNMKRQAITTWLNTLSDA